MPKKINITIKETVKFLNNAYSKSSSRLEQDRIKTLLFLCENKYSYKSEIAKKLGRTEKTIREWLKLYSNKGFDALVQNNLGGNNTRTLSDQVIEIIKEKVTDSKTSITSYVELLCLLEEQTGEDIAYGALYSHCRRKHKTKLKVARKSHYKKAPEAEALFKKPRKSI